MATGLSVLQDECDPALLLALHAGPLEPNPWAGFVAELRQRMGAVSVSLSFRMDDRAGPGVLAASSAAGLPPAHAMQDQRLHIVFAPPGSARMPWSRCVDVASFLDRADSEHLRFARDIMAGNGIEQLHVARVRHGPAGVAWLSVGCSGKTLSAGEIHQLDALLPHLELSLRTFAALERERSRALASANAVQRLNLCWFRLDLDGRILDLDPQAKALLNDRAAFRSSSSGRLVLARRGADEAMRTAIAALRRQPDGRVRAVHVSDQPWLDLLLVRSREETLTDAMEAGVIAYVHGEPHQHADRCELLRELFGLSPKEALLAIALSRGRSIAEVAVEIGLSEGSAREYTKRIYAKTSTRGQADLVRLILTSVAALA